MADSSIQDGELLQSEIAEARRHMDELRGRLAQARRDGDGCAVEELLAEAARISAMLQTLREVKRDLDTLQALLAEAAEGNTPCGTQAA